jgi:predicted patatin/cPLA2 family phospholipase
MHGDLEVLRAMVRRRDDGSRPGERSDGHRIALVVSGGGMRGAYPAGMAHALEDAGFGDVFDEAYGSSAGAFIAAGFLTGQSWAAAPIFARDMTSREFIDVRRIGTGRPVMSLDHLFDHILTVTNPFDWTHLCRMAIPLRVVATGADDLRPHVLAELRSPTDWKVGLRATATIPWLAGPPVEFGGRRWIDGSVAEPLAVIRALRGGATHVLALSSRSPQDVRAARSPAWARSLDRLAPGLGAMANDTRRLFSHNLAPAADPAHPERGGAHVLAITPSAAGGIRGLTTDERRVREATDAGRGFARAAIGTVERARA